MQELISVGTIGNFVPTPILQRKVLKLDRGAEKVLKKS